MKTEVTDFGAKVRLSFEMRKKNTKEIKKGLKEISKNKNNALRTKGKGQKLCVWFSGQKLLDSAKRLSTYEKKEMSEELK